MAITLAFEVCKGFTEITIHTTFEINIGINITLELFVIN